MRWNSIKVQISQKISCRPAAINLLQATVTYRKFQGGRSHARPATHLSEPSFAHILISTFKTRHISALLLKAPAHSCRICGACTMDAMYLI